MGTVSLTLQEFLPIFKISYQKFDRNCSRTLLQDVLKPGLPRLLPLALGMTLFRQIRSRYLPNTFLYPLKRVIIPHQSISRRTPMLKIEEPRTNKISVIRELGILAQMPDGDSLNVRRYSIGSSQGSNLIQILNQIIDLACSERRMLLQRFIPYRHATLAVQSGKCSSWYFSPSLSLTDSSTVTEAGTILSAFGSWLQALWEHDDPVGPSILFQPTGLSATIQAW
jgi:hypothetical protein